MNRKPIPIKVIYFPPDKTEQETIAAEDGKQIFEEHENMGAYGILFAVVYNHEGKLISKWNLKYLEGVEYV